MTEPRYPADEAAAEAPDATYQAPEPWRITGTGHCRSCDAAVGWAEHPTSGKRAPFDPDGASHFATCPQAEQWRKRGGPR